MGEFRIGRTFARHSYPDTPRAVNAASFARNFAVGPAEADPIDDEGTPITWPVIESGANASVAWSSTTSYSIGDFAQLGGITFVSLTNNNLNNSPDVSPGDWGISDGVPITPRTSGRCVVAGIVSVEFPAGESPNVDIQVQVTLNGTVVLNPANAKQTIEPGEVAVIPILALVADMVLNTQSLIGILVTADTGHGDLVNLVVGSSTISIQEVPVATG